MAIAVDLIGKVAQQGVSSLTINAREAVLAGSRILLALAQNRDGTAENSPSDAAGNVYDQAAGSIHPSGALSAFIFRVDNALALAKNDDITIAPPSGVFSASAIAVAVTGLTGTIVGSSSAQGTSTQPLVALGNAAAGNIVVGIIAVDGPSSDGFTQDPTFQNVPGITGASQGQTSYIGRKIIGTSGPVVYAPTLGVSRDWVALLVEMLQ